MEKERDRMIRMQLSELLRGGFAQNVPLFREFDHAKAGVILEGLHFSAWILLGHVRERQRVLYRFMKTPEENPQVWPEAFWPENYQPTGRSQWDLAIDAFEQELQEILAFVENEENDLMEVYGNGRSRFGAVLAILHHNAYHVGQLKTIGRQLGVW